MNERTPSLRNLLDLTAVSGFTIEAIARVDGLPRGGHATLLEEYSEQPGGLAYHALSGVRLYDLDAELAFGALVGGEDRETSLGLVRHLGAHTKFLPVLGKRTNRSQIFVGPGGETLIIRRTRQIRFEWDMNRYRSAQLLRLVSQSLACLLGNLPLELTRLLIEVARHAGTYIALGAGGEQLNHLVDLRPHALFLDLAGAQQATGLRSDNAEQVFASLLEISRAEHVVVMTSKETHPVYLAERLTATRWTIDSVNGWSLPGHNAHWNVLGARGSLAGTAALLLGRPRRLLTGEAVSAAVRFAQEVAVTQGTGDPWLRRQLRGRYLEIRPLFEPPEGDRSARPAARLRRQVGNGSCGPAGNGTAPQT